VRRSDIPGKRCQQAYIDQRPCTIFVNVHGADVRSLLPSDVRGHPGGHGDEGGGATPGRSFTERQKLGGDMAFDVLELDGRRVLRESWSDRRKR
jgi:hypothetical protein